MPVVLFGVSPALTEPEIQRLLNLIENIESVDSVEGLVSGKVAIALARHYIATVNESVTPTQVVERIGSLPGIDYATLPAERGFTP